MTTIEIVGSPLYQWEVGRQIRVTPSPGVRITAVQFAKLGDNEALSVAPSEPSGVIIADIPNILLQDNRSLVVYITDMSEDRIEAFTDKTFTIIGRPKPSDYVCTETEVISYAYLDNRLNKLEGEGLANAVAEYLKENPVEAGATAEEAAQIAQNKQNIATLDRTKLAASELPTAVNEALAQAKASGAFDGEPGKDGQPGADGKDYMLTPADKQEIAELAADMVEVPDVDIPTTLPNPNALTFTGAATGTYDGSAPLTVNIPAGGGGTGGGSASVGGNMRLVRNLVLTEASDVVVLDTDNDGNPFSLKEFVIFILAKVSEAGKIAYIPNGHWVVGTYVDSTNSAATDYAYRFVAYGYADTDGFWGYEIVSQNKPAGAQYISVSDPYNKYFHPLTKYRINGKFVEGAEFWLYGRDA